MSRPRVVEETAQLSFSVGSSVQKETLHILHVDDDTSFLQVSKLILENENNFLIDTAISADSALKKLQNQSYDAIVSDYEMPLKNGLDFLKELREQQRDIPFILFTGKSRENVAVKALNLGADSYINKNGSPETVYCELADAISKSVERKKSKKLLAASESKYRMLVENSLQGIMIAQGAPPRVAFANASVGKMLGYSFEEFTSFSPAEVAALIYHEDRTVFFNRFRNRLEGKQDDSSFEFRGVRKDGSIVWMEAFGIRIEYKGQPAVQATFLDINERKKAQEALRVFDEKYRVYVENSPVAFFVANFEGKYEEVNDAACKLLGYTRNELLEMNIANALFEEDVPWGLKQFASLKETGKFAMETVLKRKDGQPVYVILNSVKMPDGKLIAFCENITERKKAEREVQSLAKFPSENPNPVFRIKKDGTILFSNEAAQVIINGQKLGEKHCCIELIQQSALSCLRSGLPKETEVKFKDKTFSFEIAPIVEADYVNVYGFDVTKRKEVEKKLRESEEKYQATFESSMDALMLLDKKSFLHCNPSTLKLFGCKSVAEFIKNHPADLSPPTQPDRTQSKEAAMSHIQKALQTGTDHFFWIHKRRDGTTFPADVLLTRTPMKDQEILQATVRDITELKKSEEAIKFQADLLNHVGQAILMVDNNRIIRFWNKAAEKLYGYSEEQAMGHLVTEIVGVTSQEEANEVSKRLMAGESWSTEVLTKKRDGSLVPVILNRTPIYNGNGEFVGAASIVTEITLQKATEADLTFSLNSLSNSLDKIQELNEKLRVVGGLTMHDVRNKLSAVTGYAYLLRKKHGDQTDIMDGLGKMEHAVKEIEKIFDFAKIYEQIGSEELTYVNVEEKLNEAVALFSGPTPMIINECHGLTVLADSFLRQLFFNFIDNARKYGKKTTIIRVYWENADEDTLKLVYEDDGVGVPFENKPRLFSEGFSTGGSTGYGLFLIKKMIDVYGWKIEENGEPGIGAKFTITIPNINLNGEEGFKCSKRWLINAQ